MTPLLRVKQVSQLLGIGASTVYRLVERGTLPVVKIPGGGIRFRQERIERLIRNWEDGGRRRIKEV